MTLKGGCSDAVRDINTVAYLRRGYTTLLLILARDINTVAYLHAGDMYNTVAYPPRRGYINTVAYLHAGDMHNAVAYPPRRGYINTVAYLALHLQSTSSALGCGLEPKVG